MVGSVDLRRLHVLRLVDQTGTVTGAAAALHLTPSAVSHQIRQLAREVGVDLLEPDGRRVRLTSAGKTLVAHADALHARWEQAQAELAAHADGQVGLLRLCGFATAVSGLLVPAATRLAATAPGVTVSISEVETSQGFDAVLSGDADIAVVVLNGAVPSHDDARFELRSLCDDPLDLLVPGDHPLADRESAALTDLAHDPWVLAEPGSCDLYDLAMAAWRDAGLMPNVAHRVREYAAVASLVSCGFGVSLVPRFAQLPAHLDVVRVPLAGDQPPARHLVACLRRGSGEQPIIARGLAALHAVTSIEGTSTGDASMTGDASIADAVSVSGGY